MEVTLAMHAINTGIIYQNAGNLVNCRLLTVSLPIGLIQNVVLSPSSDDVLKSNRPKLGSNVGVKVDSCV